MMKRNFIWLALPLSATLVSGFFDPAQALDLGIASDYNVLVFGDMNQSSDSEGRVAVGGNATFTNFGIGDRLDNSYGSDNRLVVGGDLTYNGGQIFGGNAVVGGSVNTSVNFNCNGCQIKSGNPIDFVSAKVELDNISNHLAALDTTGTSELKWGGIHLEGNGGDTSVFDIDGSWFSQTSYMNLNNVARDSTIVFNIYGEDVEIQNFGISALQNGGYDLNKVVFNFVDATQVKTSGFSFQGSVLATQANFQFDNGNVEGNFVASSVSGSGEFHNRQFNSDDISEPTTQAQPPVDDAAKVPEPSSLLGLAMVGGLVAAKHRRNKSY